jgi:hypothetical protein
MRGSLHAEDVWHWRPWHHPNIDERRSGCRHDTNEDKLGLAVSGKEARVPGSPRPPSHPGDEDATTRVAVRSW